jgi:prophage regulatory protein
MNDPILRFPEVVKQTGLSRATIYRRIEVGDFPKPSKITDRAVGWRASVIEAWKVAHVGVSMGVSAQSDAA